MNRIVKGLQEAIQHARGRTVDSDFLLRFVTESNRIEGIKGATNAQLQAHASALMAEPLRVADLEAFVDIVQPGAQLRRRVGLNVCVGDYVAPSGAPGIEDAVAGILQDAAGGYGSPYETHVRYELLHPFTDGNGRSGRLVWLWQMLRSGDEAYRLGFLHAFYYQTLAARAPRR